MQTEYAFLFNPQPYFKLSTKEEISVNACRVQLKKKDCHDDEKTLSTKSTSKSKNTTIFHDQWVPDYISKDSNETRVEILSAPFFVTVKNTSNVTAKRFVAKLLAQRIVFRNLAEPIGGLSIPLGTIYSLRGYFVNIRNGGYRFITPCPFKQVSFMCQCSIANIFMVVQRLWMVKNDFTINQDLPSHETVIHLAMLQSYVNVIDPEMNISRVKHQLTNSFEPFSFAIAVLADRG